MPSSLGLELPPPPMSLREHVLTPGGPTGIAAIAVFLDPRLFGRFGLPATR